MGCRLCSYLVLLAFWLMLGCGGQTSEEATVSETEEAREDVQVEMTKTDKDSYSVQVKSGTKELQLSAKGTGDDSYSMEVKGTEGEMKMSAGLGAALPENFPPDVPSYPGMTITFSQSVAQNESFTVQGKSSDPLEKVADQFKADTAAKGWTEATSVGQIVPGTEMKFLQYSKEDRTLNIMLNNQAGETNITISTAKK